LKIHLRLINFIGLIVPRRLRADWKQEWEAELRHREALLADWAKLNWRTKLNLLWRSLGSFWDALWLQQLRWEDEMLQDLRYGLRLLRKSPGFSAVAVLSLALGIGANTAVFSLVDAVLLKMMPVEKPEQLVLFRWVSGDKTMVRSFYGSMDNDKKTGLSSSISFSYPAFEYLRDHNHALSDIFGFARLEQLNVNVDGQSEIAGGQVVTGGYFSGLGVPAILGRTVTDQDDKSGADPAAVLSYGYWQRRFGSNPSAVGKVIYLNGTAFTVVGVTPPEFYGAMDIGAAPDISVPMAFQPVLLPTRGTSALNDPTNWWLFVMGRLQPGVSSEHALANLNTALQQHALELQRSFQDQRDLPQLRFEDGSRGLGEVRRGQSKPLSILMGSVALVLLIACINVANLLLARAAARQKEIAIRLSVGASRFRLIRQLLTESVVLSLLGGMLGLAFAYWGADAMMSLLSSGSIPVGLDLRVLGFTAAVSLLTGVLFGLAPAFRATRLELTPMLKEGSGSTGPARSRLSKALIVAQVALSLVLLIGAGLFVRTLRNLSNLDVGFNRENLLIFRVQPRMSGYEGERLKNVYQQIIERIEAVPGVRAATLSRHPLLSGSSASNSITVPGYTPQPDEDTSVPVLAVGTNFFETMEIPILMGHGFAPQDNQPTSSVVIINQALARQYFGNQNPVGQHIYLDKFNATNKETRKDRPLEIVGVIQDAKYDSLRAQIRPTIYVPYLQNSVPTQMSFAIRTAGDPSAMTTAIRQAVHSLDGNLPLFAVKTQNAQIAERVAQSRLFADLSSLFGFLALALVSVGLYGVMSFTVARRTHEIGIRMALGAQAHDVRRMVMRETLVLTAIGMVIGIGAAVATTGLIASQLFGLSANDPLTITMAVLVLMVVAAVAGGLPARRASRVDPMIALRHE
jgi:predicted permease